MSLEMSSFPELVRTLLTLKPGLPMVQLVSDQGVPITKYLPTVLAAEPHLVMDDADMPGEMVPYLVDLLAVGAGEATNIRISNVVNLGFMRF